jgi:hypothetical protein
VAAAEPVDRDDTHAAPGKRQRRRQPDDTETHDGDVGVRYRAISPRSRSVVHIAP